MSEIRVVVIDSDPLFRAGVAYTLNGEPDLAVVGEGTSASDAFRLAAALKPDVIVLDIGMLGGGAEAVETLVAHCSGVKLLMLTSIVDDQQVCSAMQGGAWGYVLKGVGGPELVQSVRVIHRGERYVTPALAARLFAKPRQPAPRAEQTPFSSLTGREDQILTLLAEGLSNKEIGGRLEISEKTVKHYLTIILDKLNVRNRVQAALLAYNRSNLVGH
ncbi:LuxR C-terminal-related transcriptional regulator [Methylobacterium oxalidis]|uniref:DNA-binding response regulator n=1 Tax=Methylobacterium oxalidis TaxID=944322 RepID=A0A512JBP4_9HYPH|nr:response regulator transcription factor [Methylobacterium oxalidis]GEP07366.1 DNA-binding response regulator [Methylobacterium oxalidis]GJE33341.1 Transcriptional regulatory protein LiaR [Methylobacterium oxalidis]GLS63473.1 DNA-binding response regulator [Methylobacterium oxalidis]